MPGTGFRADLYLAKRVLFDDLPIDRTVYELPRELDPFVDRRRGRPSGFELLVRPFRTASSNLVGRNRNSQGEIDTAMYLCIDA